jgi:aminoglycoside phosphotransferase (APT) family kinase protein
LEWALARLEEGDSAARPGLGAARALVLPRRAEVQTQLARLRALQEQVRRLPAAPVLCHTDIGPENLLVDDAGALSVLDWDDATVAPPEHDLQCAVELDLPRFLHVYRAAGGGGPLHLEQFAFALLRRYLADLTARLLRLLDEHGTAAEEDELLAGMEQWGFAAWRSLDQTLAGIARALTGDNP